MGDIQGHNFHGNQYIAGEAGPRPLTFKQSKEFSGPEMEIYERKRVIASLRALARKTLVRPTTVLGTPSRAGADMAARYATEFDVMTVNDCLRGTSACSRSGGKPDARVVADLDAAIDAGRTARDAPVYRLLLGTFFDTLKAGKAFVDRGYVSTSRSFAGMQKIVKSSQTRENEAMAIIEIRVPKGTRALDMNRAFSRVGRRNRFAYQDEILLGRGHKFKVLSHSKETATAVWELVA